MEADSIGISSATLELYGFRQWSRGFPETLPIFTGEDDDGFLAVAPDLLWTVDEGTVDQFQQPCPGPSDGPVPFS